jgi:hypothetical protein
MVDGEMGDGNGFCEMRDGIGKGGVPTYRPRVNVDGFGVYIRLALWSLPPFFSSPLLFKTYLHSYAPLRRTESLIQLRSLLDP